MNTEKLVISINSGSIVISKGEKSFGMEKSCDNDIWFGLSLPHLSMHLKWD